MPVTPATNKQIYHCCEVKIVAILGTCCSSLFLVVPITTNSCVSLLYHNGMIPSQNIFLDHFACLDFYCLLNYQASHGCLEVSIERRGFAM